MKAHFDGLVAMGANTFFLQKKTSNLIPYNMKYESKITRRQGNNEARI